MSRMIFDENLVKKFHFIWLISASHVSIRIEDNPFLISRTLLFILFLTSRLFSFLEFVDCTK
jgi:hypothetical protein